jgi:dynactin complex subunit
MIKHNEKFENLEVELVNLQDVLKNSLQQEVLTIKRLDKEGKKFKSIENKFDNLQSAEYVIFSVHMCKNYHESESFVFVDATGKTVCTISGREIDLYDMIKNCDNLIENDKY